MKSTSLLAATTLVAGALTVPTAMAEPLEDSLPAVESGHLNWPIKESFVQYVQKPFAKGKITAEDGVELVGDSFDFPIDPSETGIDADGNGVIGTDGSIHFQAHPTGDGSYGLDMKISDVEIRVNGTTASIVVDYAVTGTLGSPTGEPVAKTGKGAVMSTFELDEPLKPEAEKSYSFIDKATTLTEGANEAMVGFYSDHVGKPLEDGDTDLEVTFAKTFENSGPTDDGETSEDKGSSFGDTQGSSNGGIMGAVFAVLAVLGIAGAGLAGLAGLIPGLKLSL